jgi:hypothetical protein
MQPLTLVLNNDHSVGLGDNLCLLSALANLSTPVQLAVNNKYNTFDRLTHYAKIFRIPKSQLEIIPTEENGMFNNVGWPVKLFTEYYKPLFVNVHGQVVKLNNGRKDCIAIVAAFEQDPTGNNEWPWCRNRSLDYWARIFSWLKAMNYDVVTLDYAYHDLENKVEILAKHCKAIISYEGGMAHLAHMMNLPCFLVNWNLPSPSTTLGSFHCEFVHKTNSVYILHNDEEIFTWDRAAFDSKIEDLLQGKTNNRLVNDECKITFTGPGCRGQVMVRDKNNNLKLQAPPLFGDTKVSEVLTSHYFKSFNQNT